MVLGLYCRDDLLAREIEETVLSLRMGAGCGEKPVRGMDYELRRLASLPGAFEDMTEGDGGFFLILAGEKPELLPRRKGFGWKGLFFLLFMWLRRRRMCFRLCLIRFTIW